MSLDKPVNTRGFYSRPRDKHGRKPLANRRSGLTRRASPVLPTRGGFIGRVPAKYHAGDVEDAL